ncbi:hypothetical protein H6F67_05975 [Microcoleus sp. FACHB-1515]|uniref:pilus motility taxis protein HmpF n=1 Tax=Cyanophyceae TaxID=3028117 RepID=UPI001686A9C5|nr:pilus motility taxis protein HmpF [Microcoleus sp. FACHB-1515]MBD2089397.1 hypothetical protein [Microcoleus sp. FACHB-1515]
MLYLAEVQRKTRVIGGGRAELKLLACQRNEQSWSAVPAEEPTVPAPDDAMYNAGALVMVEISGARQVQRHSEAGRQLVSILQNFSRLQEKFKTQEEEIEQWKESLTYQSQELNRREMEMEAREEQIQQMEEDFEKLEQQKQEFETFRAETEQMRAEFERKSQELEGAWAHLQGEMNRFEEKAASAGLNAEQAQQLQAIIDRLSAAAPTAAVREQLDQAFAILTQQQETLNYHWHNLEQQRNSAHELQATVDRQAQELLDRKQQWQQQQAAIAQSRIDLSVKQSLQSIEQQQAQTISAQLQTHESLQQQIRTLAESAGVRVGPKVDVEAIEQKSIQELQAAVQELQRDFEKSSKFVQGQEEELTLQKQTVDELRAKLQQSGNDRAAIEAELRDEQDRYKMLDQTLIGQRRNLHEREEVLHQHQVVLARKQGLPEPEAKTGSEFDGVANQLEFLRQQQAQTLQMLEVQIQQRQTEIDQAQGAIDQQVRDHENEQRAIEEFEQQWQAQKSSAAELWGKVNAYQDTLQPMQDSLNGLREKLEAVSGLTHQFQEVGDQQQQAIAEIQQHLQGATPEFAAH